MLSVGYGDDDPCGTPVEFFNLVLGMQMTADEKQDLVAFLRTQ
jgi:hypothetical protein